MFCPLFRRRYHGMSTFQSHGFQRENNRAHHRTRTSTFIPPIHLTHLLQNLENRTPYMIPPSQHDTYPRNYTPPATRNYDDYGHYPQPPSHPYPQPYYIPSQNPNGKRNAPEVVPNLSGEDHPNAKRTKAAAAVPNVSTSTSSSKRPSHSRQQGSSQSQSRPGTGGVASTSSSLVAQTTPATRLSSPDEVAQEPISPYGPFQRYDSLPVGAKQPKEVVNAAIVAYLRSHIQTEDGYQDFSNSKGRLLPIPELLKGYRFATRIVNTWANRKTPPTIEGCPNKRITKARPLRVLFTILMVFSESRTASTIQANELGK